MSLNGVSAMPGAQLGDVFEKTQSHGNLQLVPRQVAAAGCTLTAQDGAAAEDEIERVYNFF